MSSSVITAAAVNALQLVGEVMDYAPQGGSLEIFTCREPEILIDGPAGTGKTRGILEKVHLAMEKYPGARGLLVRKTREALSESVLVTFEDHVVPEGHEITAGGLNRHYRQGYEYANGSYLGVQGMKVGGKDQIAKLMSTEWDIIAVFEGTELTEDEFEKLTTRLRNGKMPYQQVIVDCNPAAPRHWLLQRTRQKGMKRIQSRHEDNPILYDAKAGEWTERGKAYLATLDKLTGARHARLRKGLWVATEGAVYEQDWDPVRHVVDVDLEVVRKLMRWSVAGVDWGFTNPGAIEVLAVDGDGRKTLVAEEYHSAKGIEWWIEQAKELRDRWDIKAFACDPARPEFLVAFRKAGLPAVEAINDIEIGIRQVQEELRTAGDGLPRLIFSRSALRHPDPALVDSSQPSSVEHEFEAYIYPPKQDGKPDKELPVDNNNHGLDALRYAVMYAHRNQASRVPRKVLHGAPWANNI